MRKSKTYYLVIKGRNPGIYESWNECKPQLQGFLCPEFYKYKGYHEALIMYNKFLEVGAIELPAQPRKSYKIF